MAGIDSFMQRTCKQTAVYWQPLGTDGYGGKTFYDAVELTPPNGVHWEDKIQLLQIDDGSQISSRAVVYTIQDIEIEGMLYLGTLDSLYDSAESSAGAIDDPLAIDDTYIIKKFEKSPSINAGSYVRKAWLIPLLT